MGGVDQPKKRENKTENCFTQFLCLSISVAVTRNSQQGAVSLTCRTETVVEQLGGQEACGAGRGRICCCPTIHRFIYWRWSGGGFKHSKSILPLSAELIVGPWAWAEEVLQKGHVAPFHILFLHSQHCSSEEGGTTWKENSRKSEKEKCRLPKSESKWARKAETAEIPNMLKLLPQPSKSEAKKLRKEGKWEVKTFPVAETGWGQPVYQAVLRS